MGTGSGGETPRTETGPPEVKGGATRVGVNLFLRNRGRGRTSDDEGSQRSWSVVQTWD